MKRALALLLVSGTAYAGGTVRPNGISARGVSLGGAWVAWADDATAIYFNPAALDAMEPQVMLGAEFVLGPRKYTPVAADGTRGEPQTTTIASPVPTLGVVGRFSYNDQPSRFTLGLGVWNTFGGRVSYPKTGMPALDATQDLCIEINGAAALHISDRFAIGGAVRLGLGFFHVESTMNPFDADLSSSGVGVAMTWGALIRPTDRLRVGLNWRSPMRVTTTGRGTVTTSTGTDRPEIRHDQNWPQMVQLGLAYNATERLRIATQVDWAQWSQIDTIEVLFPDGTLPNQIYPEYWEDNWTVRLGGEYAFSRKLQLRAGTYYDTPAVPDRTLERQYSDSQKVGVSLGGSLHAGGWRFDIASDAIIPRLRTVENNADDVMGVGALVNKAPGDYIGSLITFELAATRQF
ncbi:MAG TPA: outer membrane protein transport protein [Kofleriaceae bacterium]